MKHPLASLLLVGVALLPITLTTPARAATMILHNFTGVAGDGGDPFGSLKLSGSKLYGMTLYGNNSDRGTVFSMNSDGTGFGLLHTFAGGANDGSQPRGSLTLSGSKLYGMTYYGGSANNGTIFSMNTNGTGFTLLHTFTFIPSDGVLPLGTLTLSGTKLYGMTSQSSSGGGGTVFSMNTDGTGFGLLHSFTGSASDGYNPHGSLTLVGSQLYGMTYTGGLGGGTIFRINTDGTGFGLLHNFAGGPDGQSPVGSLTLAGSKLYGMTAEGGIDDRGTIFSLNTDGTGYSMLHSFTGGDGSGPDGSLTLSGSTLYGMTYGGGSLSQGNGTIFSIRIDGTGFSLLDSFGGPPTDGSRPYGDLTLSADASTLYGMTNRGGTADLGVVFSRSIAVPEPAACALLGLGAVLLSARRRNARP